MSGFVGSRARKKQRNIIMFLCFLILIGIFYYIYPKIQTFDDNLIPNENILPDPNEELTSLASDIEELQLSVFQKDQQIKFRDGQIKKLAIELKETKSQYDSSIRALNQVNDDLNLLSSNNENLLVTSDKFKSCLNNISPLSLLINKTLPEEKKIIILLSKILDSIIL